MDKLERAIHEALCVYDHENVDIVVNDDGSIDIMYRSDNSPFSMAFCIDENVWCVDNISEDDIDDIIKIADNYGVGCLF